MAAPSSGVKRSNQSSSASSIDSFMYQFSWSEWQI
jgi:hypothetical protein